MKIINLEEREEILAGDDTRLRELLHPRLGHAELPYSLAHAYLPPGARSRPHRLLEHTETYVFTEGAGVLVVEGERQPVVAGDVAVVPAGAEQWLENHASERLAFFCIVSPPWTAESETLSS